MNLLRQTSCWICIASQIVLLGCQREQQQTPQVIPFKGTDKGTERTQAIDRLKCQLIAVRHLTNAKISAINSTSDFIVEKINNDRMENFSESLRGMYDAFIVLWDANGGGNIEEAVNKRFAEHVVNQDDQKELQNKLTKHYNDALLAIAANTFMLTSDSDYPYDGVQKLREKFNQNDVFDPADAYGGNKAILGRAMLEAVDVTLMAVEGGLIIAGLLGAPETGGWSLILTGAGVVLLAADQAWAAFEVSFKDTMMTQLQACSTQNLHGLMLEHLPIVSNPPTVGEASIAMSQEQMNKSQKNGQQIMPFVELLHKSATEKVYPKVIEAIFGEDQEQ